jgi:hypothetical protein
MGTGNTERASHVCLPTYRKDECREDQLSPLDPLSSSSTVAGGHDGESSPAPVLSFEQRFQALDICSLQQIRVETSGKAYFAHNFIAVCRKGDQVGVGWTTMPREADVPGRAR